MNISSWSAWLLGHDIKRRRRTAMAAVATGMMACCALAMQVFAAGGNPDPSEAGWWSLVAVGGLFTALVLVRSGISERWADPSLTFFQMLWALTCNAVAYVIAGPLGALVLPVLVIILMFGIFGRDRQQTVWLMVYSMVLYTCAVFGGAYLADPRPPTTLIAAHFTIVMLSVIAGTLMCLQVQGIRARLRRQKRDLEIAMAKIHDIAMHDELTGLFNRRQMAELMALELRRSRRGGRQLVLAQLDIDHFKRINDGYGHAAGDQALKTFSRRIAAELRSGDVLARWGGEEFVLMLCDTRSVDAADLLERLRIRVSATPVSLGNVALGMTVSIGWALHQRGESLEGTLARADEALYAAKRQGRDQVVFARAPGPFGRVHGVPARHASGATGLTKS